MTSAQPVGRDPRERNQGVRARLHVPKHFGQGIADKLRIYHQLETSFPRAQKPGAHARG
jgi:hypothetical protein